MITIEELGGIQDLDQKQLIKIVGGGTGKTATPEVIPYEPLGFPTCPLYLFPDGTVAHYCPGEPKPKLPVNDPLY